MIKVTVVSSDAVRFELTHKAALDSGLLEMLDDGGEIPLPK